MDIAKAEMYLIESLEIEKIDLNHLNMGHIHLIKGEEKEAAKEYSNGCIKTKNIDAFVEMMLPDYADLNLLQYSVSEEQYIASLQKAVAICKKNE